MPIYINTATLEYPVSAMQIRRANPNVSFPNPFAPPEGFAEVTKLPAPTVADGMAAVPKAPELLNGVWVRDWQVISTP